MSEERPDLAATLDHYGVMFNPDRVSQKVLCPVHEEYIESCSINLDEQWFNCHACGAKGDSWNLIMAKEKCDFVTAIARAEGITKGTNSRGQAERRAGTLGLLGHIRPARHRGKRVPFRPKLGRD